MLLNEEDEEMCRNEETYHLHSNAMQKTTGYV